MSIVYFSYELFLLLIISNLSAFSNKLIHLIPALNTCNKASLSKKPVKHVLLSCVRIKTKNSDFLKYNTNVCKFKPTGNRSLRCFHHNEPSTGVVIIPDQSDNPSRSFPVPRKGKMMSVMEFWKEGKMTAAQC